MEITKKVLLNELMNDEQYANNIVKTTRNKPIVNAIKDRKKITFYYSGPRRPKKDSVKAGYRVKVEPVAIGLNKKRNLVLRAWVDVPSTTKTGFGKGHWRTFILSRTNNVQVTDETFNEKRPGYNDNGDRSMTVVYAKTDWTKTDSPKKEVIPTKEPVSKEKEPVKAEPTKVEPAKVEPKSKELPQPKPEVKPEPAPTPETPPKEEPKPEEEPQAQELPQPKPQEKPEPNPEDEKTDEKDNQLQESIKRIKSLMFL
jgi:hypothetical protein